MTVINRQNYQEMMHLEWLATNGLGGFACGSLLGVPMRKYHSLLIAALHVPLGRTVMLNYVEETIVIDHDQKHALSFIRSKEHEEIPSIPLIEFRMDDGIPIWVYQIGEFILEKRVHLVHQQNTAHITYRTIGGNKPVSFSWRPFFNFRNYESPVNIQQPDEYYSVGSKDKYFEVTCPSFPPLRLYNTHSSSFTLEQRKLENIYYQYEAERGYECLGSLTSPGYFYITIQPDEEFTIIASTEEWETIDALSPHDAWFAEKLRRKNILKEAKLLEPSNEEFSEMHRKLVLAADQFIFKPITRYRDIIRLQASGEEPCSVIAGYPWFTDWGRDTMISLEGLTLSTGRQELAYSILRTFAYYVKNGLIPNMFPDTQKAALYHTADATLWFFHAVQRYVDYTYDLHFLELVLPIMETIIDWHVRGTDYGIRVDDDGLLIQGMSHYQLTWMDAKVGDWVVTPRRGKSVEINALWYNALKLLEQWTGKTSPLAEKCFESFNKKFWNEQQQHLYDVIEGENGDDAALRPNQLFAISLDFPVLEKSRWQSVVDIAREHLLTPVGMRTLAPFHPDYKSRYFGDLRSRDAAYHQGTVWPWLLGPFIDAWMRVYPEDIKNPEQFLLAMDEHLGEHCVYSVSEIFDATEPYTGRGCFAQAWSVAEILRCVIKVNNKRKIAQELGKKS